ncbi:MAG: tail fiber domain-containing protein [Planctomycetota bacterium]
MFATLPTSRFPLVTAACAGLFCLGVCRVGNSTDIISPANVTAASDPFIQLSQTGGTPYNWTLEADEVKFSIRDLSGGQFPFQISSGSLQNSIWIGNNRQIGIGTDTPQKDLHVATTTNTQTIRLQGTSQIWDIEADNLGFELVNSSAITRPLFVGVNGSVGIGTSSPDANSRVDIRSTLLNGLLMKSSAATGHYLRVENSGGIFRSGVQGNGDAQFGALSPTKGLNLLAGGTSKMTINSDGQVSFGNPPLAVPPTDAVMTSTGAHLTLAGVWADNSSRAAKQNIEPITSEQARDTMRALQPMTYRYKVQPEEPYAGFIAEDVPELVATSDRKSLAPMDFVAVLTKVVQDQSVQLDEQKIQLEDQRTAMAKQRELNQRLEQLLDEQRKQANEQQTTLAALLKRLEGIERNANGAPAK